MNDIELVKDEIVVPFLNKNLIEKFNNYCLEKYTYDVEHQGLKKTWTLICKYICIDKNKNPFFSIDSLHNLYEYGLSIQNKNDKKKNGQYYTPHDIALIMSEWFNKSDGEAICDVACGTGRLILTYLELIGSEKARQIIFSKKLYLYDFDETALLVCKTIILIKYGFECAQFINIIHGDFLSKKTKLPNNCKVISNPPYAAIKSFSNNWEKTDVLKETKEFYSVFMEKIFKLAKSSVIITPFSFISGNKFYSLRKEMCKEGNGSIFSFDNVPGNIFYGKKYGIFNANMTNSVRAAITIFNKANEKGFKVAPLIRFKNEERKMLLQCSTLDKLLPNSFQVIDDKNKTFKKIDKNLESIFFSWINDSAFKINDLIVSSNSNYLIDMPNTCRYFTTASSKKLQRTGSITLNIENEDYFNFLYCFINSSFTYWWWRIFDGGITYQKGLLKQIPIPFNLSNQEDKIFFAKMCKNMIKNEKKHMVIKMNAGKPQQNIKFPQKYRIEINNHILKMLGLNKDSSIFDSIHSNTFFKDINERK